MGALEEKRFCNIDAALAAFFQGLPREAQIAVIPDGPYAYARTGNAEVELPELSAPHR
jgi:hypothetical protein